MNNSNYFKLREKHNFHLVDNSQLPIYTAITVFQLVLSFVYYWNPTIGEYNRWLELFLFQVAVFGLLIGLFSWFYMVIEEAGNGHHTTNVQAGLRLGMILFIISEIMFFFAFFWAFFHFSVSPSIAIGWTWPPFDMQKLDIFGLPLLNTIILLFSGVTITLAHNEINKENYVTFRWGLVWTLLLGLLFLYCQFMEYKYGISFHWKENIFSTIFFVLTGFHGFHVTIGAIFLLVCVLRAEITYYIEQKKREIIDFVVFNIKPAKRIWQYTLEEIYEILFPWFFWMLQMIFNISLPLGTTLIVVGGTYLIFDHNTIFGYSIIKIVGYTFCFLLAWEIYEIRESETNWLKKYPYLDDAKVKIRLKAYCDLKILPICRKIDKWKRRMQSKIKLMLIQAGLPNFVKIMSFDKNNHLGFEAAAWYWHFVDVVWIFLFITVYWWSL